MATKQSKNYTSMEELLASSASQFKAFTKLQKIDATLKSVGKKSALFDVNGKTDGIVEGDAFIEAKNFIKTLKVGDTVRALVLDPENREGATVLSLRHAAAENFWKRMEEFYKAEKIIEVTGQSASAHGLMVSVEQESAFIPTSQFGPESPENLEDYIGKRIKVKIIDLDRVKQRIVLSERAVSEDEDIKKLKDALSAVKKGEIFEGKVTTIVSFGVFVEIDVKGTPIEGLVHISEMSWGKIDSPEEMVEEGQTVKVSVIGVEKEKLALSMKAAAEDPWKDVDYQSDDKVKGKIVRISDYGVFVELKPGVEGLIHMTKIAPGTSLKEGQEINCYIEDVDVAHKKISLGIVVTTSKPIGYK